jgi:hypothetical protein
LCSEIFRPCNFYALKFSRHVGNCLTTGVLAAKRFSGLEEDLVLGGAFQSKDHQLNLQKIKRNNFFPHQIFSLPTFSPPTFFPTNFFPYQRFSNQRFSPPTFCPPTFFPINFFPTNFFSHQLFSPPAFSPPAFFPTNFFQHQLLIFLHVLANWINNLLETYL